MLEVIDHIKQDRLSVLLAVPALIVFAILAWQLDFTQDDAYISYRYVANYINGHGLVYNIGERIEGFTNFGWVVYLIFWGALGVEFLLMSKLTGFALGVGVVILTYLLAQAAFSRWGRWPALIATYLVAFNQSLAYWSPAGLETSAFAFLATLALYLYLRRSWLLIAALTLAVWVRPEGALVAGLLIVVDLLVNRRLPRFVILCTAAAFVASLPFVVFKLGYYGSILPNPFYAKTGFHLDQIVSGIEYVGRFMKHYGFVGLGLIIPLAFFRRLSEPLRAVWLYTVLYSIYIVLVGGDVLKVHRFFLPVLAGYALLAAGAVGQLAARIGTRSRTAAHVGVGVVLIVLTILLPRGFVKQYNELEQGFTKRMHWLAQQMQRADTTDFSVAVPTIGVFGYELLGHKIIDMVGLTDSTVARHAEEPIQGLTSTWKERKHNSRYLLQRQPDYILFSTGVKPSAPAERALLLYPSFLNAYRSVGWYYQTSPGVRGTLSNVWKRVRPVKGDIVPLYSIEYVEHYKDAMDAYASGQYRRALTLIAKARALRPPPGNIYLKYYTAFCQMMLGENEQAYESLNQVLAEDSLLYEAHKDLYLFERVLNNPPKAAIHERWLRELVPWYWPRVKMLADTEVRRLGGR